jgi:hypothetical protein
MSKKKDVLHKPVNLTQIAISLISLVLKFVYSGRSGFELTDKINRLLYPPVDPFKCKYHDTPPKDTYLETYVVQPGDTLLSIAQNRLHDSSRVDELIILNHDKYPYLTRNNTFIEAGWKLLFPPAVFKQTSGNIGMIRGAIMSIEQSDHWFITTDTSQREPLYGDFYVGQATFAGKGKSYYKVGDCVSILFDYNQMHEYMLVTPQ